MRFPDKNILRWAFMHIPVAPKSVRGGILLYNCWLYMYLIMCVIAYIDIVKKERLSLNSDRYYNSAEMIWLLNHSEQM